MGTRKPALPGMLCSPLTPALGKEGGDLPDLHRMFQDSHGVEVKLPQSKQIKTTEAGPSFPVTNSNQPGREYQVGWMETQSSGWSG